MLYTWARIRTVAYLYLEYTCMVSVGACAVHADRRMSQMFTMPQVPYININIIYVCLLARMRPCSRGALRPTAATRYSNHKRYIIYRSRNTVIADDLEWPWRVAKTSPGQYHENIYIIYHLYALITIGSQRWAILCGSYVTRGQGQASRSSSLAVKAFTSQTSGNRPIWNAWHT